MGEQEGTGGEETQVVSEQLHRVLLYLSSRTPGALCSVCVCVCPRCERSHFPATLLGHITHQVQ